MNRINWRLTIGFILVIAAFLSYPFFFYQFPVTRDVPWVNGILFVIASALLISGARRAQRRRAAWIFASVSIGLIAALSVFMYVFSRQLPAKSLALQVGQHAPDFTLPDTNHKPVALASLEASAPKAVLLVFYRGYW